MYLDLPCFGVLHLLKHIVGRATIAKRAVNLAHQLGEDALVHLGAMEQIKHP